MISGFGMQFRTILYSKRDRYWELIQEILKLSCHRSIAVHRRSCVNIIFETSVKSSHYFIIINAEPLPWCLNYCGAALLSQTRPFQFPTTATTFWYGRNAETHVYILRFSWPLRNPRRWKSMRRSPPRRVSIKRDMPQCFTTQDLIKLKWKLFISLLLTVHELTNFKQLIIIIIIYCSLKGPSWGLKKQFLRIYKIESSH